MNEIIPKASRQISGRGSDKASQFGGEKGFKSYLPVSELLTCFLLPSVFLVLNVGFDCCLEELGIGELEALPSLLELPFMTVAAMLFKRFQPSPTIGSHCCGELFRRRRKTPLTKM